MENAMRRVTKDSETGCWNYAGYKSRGYPTIVRRVEDKATYTTAHKFFFERLVEKVPPGKILMHSCDNRLCCNPEHLRIGTQSENMKDMWAKGRGRTTFNRTLLSPDVKAAAIVLAKAGATKTFLAKALGISNTTITGWLK